MKLDQAIKSLKYIPKIWTALGYLLLLLFSLMLFFGRNFEIIRIAALVDVFPDFYNHISNFSLSLIIYITIGYVGLMADLTLIPIIVIGLTILLLNLVTEFLISFLNTPDIIDAIYGIAGVVLGFVFLFLANRYGYKTNDIIKTNTQ
jgi:hypothetical protein